MFTLKGFSYLKQSISIILGGKSVKSLPESLSTLGFSKLARASFASLCWLCDSQVNRASPT
jgi:hypothetical protein